MAVQEERYDDAKQAKIEVERLIKSALRPDGELDSSFVESERNHY